MNPSKDSVMFEFSFAHLFLCLFSSINNPLIIYQFVCNISKFKVCQKCGVEINIAVYHLVTRCEISGCCVTQPIYA